MTMTRTTRPRSRLAVPPLAAAGLAALAAGLAAGCAKERAEPVVIERPIDERGVTPSPGEGPWDELSVRGLRRVGLLAFEEGRYRDALPVFQAFTVRRPGDAEGHLFVGRTLLELGRPDSAREAFGVAMDLDPDDIRHAQGFANAMIELDDAQAGLTRLEETAVRLAEVRGDSEGLVILGETAERAGLLDEAVNAYRRAAAVDRGQNLEAQRALARVYRAIGDTESEITRLRVLLGLLEETPELDQVRARLRALGRVPGPSYVLEPFDGQA